MIVVVGTVLIGVSCWSFFQDFGLGHEMLMLKCINEITFLKAKNSSLNIYDYINIYKSNTDLQILFVDKLLNEKVGMFGGILTYEEAYDAYENIGLNQMSFSDQWLIDYNKSILSNESWKTLESRFIEDITESQMNINKEEDWFDHH